MKGRLPFIKNLRAVSKTCTRLKLELYYVHISCSTRYHFFSYATKIVFNSFISGLTKELKTIFVAEDEKMISGVARNMDIIYNSSLTVTNARSKNA